MGVVSGGLGHTCTKSVFSDGMLKGDQRNWLGLGGHFVKSFVKLSTDSGEYGRW